MRCPPSGNSPPGGESLARETETVTVCDSLGCSPVHGTAGKTISGSESRLRCRRVCTRSPLSRGPSGAFAVLGGARTPTSLALHTLPGTRLAADAPQARAGPRFLPFSPAGSVILVAATVRGFGGHVLRGRRLLPGSVRTSPPWRAGAQATWSGHVGVFRPTVQQGRQLPPARTDAGASNSTWA